MTTKQYSLWLTPSKEDDDYLSAIIDKLANTYDAPVFRPHCTIFHPINDVNAAKQMLDQIATKPFEVTCQTLDFTNTLSKTVFIALRDDQQLQTLNQLFSNAFSGQYDFQPHISLIYKHLDTATKQAIIHALSLKKTYRMTGIELVDATDPITTTTWQSAYRVSLATNEH